MIQQITKAYTEINCKLFTGKEAEIKIELLEEGALSILLIIIGNGIMTWVQIWNEAVYISLCANALEKDMNPSVFSLTMGK